MLILATHSNKAGDDRRQTGGLGYPAILRPQNNHSPASARQFEFVHINLIDYDDMVGT